MGGLHFNGWILWLHGWMLDEDENRKICKSFGNGGAAAVALRASTCSDIKKRQVHT